MFYVNLLLVMCDTAIFKPMEWTVTVTGTVTGHFCVQKNCSRGLELILFLDKCFNSKIKNLHFAQTNCFKVQKVVV